MEHTPGPWKAHVSLSGRAWTIFAGVAPDNDVIARVNGGFEQSYEANARLIASVPELLEALKAIAQIAGNLPDEHLTDKTGPNDAAHRGLMYCHARELARAAIEKAEEGGT